ncbi:MAG: copper resistance protein CopC [Chloroflexi bacterium]|nr:copper resistance protein CopC [Chloroflexota bacterium]
MSRRIRWIGVCILLVTSLLAQPVWAHAVLARATPGVNASLTKAPDEIRLWFTEPVEPNFSSFRLRDINGALVKTPASQVDSTDPHQMYMKPGSLPNGLYTVVWAVNSAADGHHTEGSFAFTIGPVMASQPTTSGAETTIPVVGALARWFNLIGLALGVGSIGFLCFVWQPANLGAWPTVEQRLRRITWIGWWWLGLSGALLLLLQTSTMINTPLLQALRYPALLQVIRGTRFGTLWSARMELWLVIGGLLLLTRQHPRLRWLALLFGLLLLLLTSLYSHASAAHEAGAAMLSDWFHLAMTAFWIGGLVQFFGIISLLRRVALASTFGKLVGYFSNYARITVAGLLITGLYAAWLQVGSFEGLLTTLYGQALLVKLILLLPLLGVAGVNLLVTQRRLQAGQALWMGRLRGLMGAEITLAAGLLLAVGLMTSISPARGELTQRAINKVLAALPPPQPLMDMQVVDDLQIHLIIEPGWVGENKFTVILSTPDNMPVTDAALIRLRFQNQTQDLGESELQITQHQGNVYAVKGANLSVPGEWKVRMTVQRPEQFDSVVDFMPQVPLPPPPPAMPVIESSPVLPYQVLALLLTGLLALGLGGYFIGQNGFRFWQGVGPLAAGLTLIGGIFLIMAVT